MTRNLIKSTIANNLGTDQDDISPEAEFQLDLNATPEEMQKIKIELERMLDIELPEFEENYPETVNDLYEMVDDALL